MDDGNESGTPGPDSVAALSQRNLSLSEDESLLDSNMDIADEDLLFADIQDDEDDLGSSSELSVSPFEQAEFALVSGGKQSTDSSSKENLPSDPKSDLPGNSEANQIQPTRSSGRLRKEKVPNNQRRNLFPGRPRVTNRGRKFNMNLSDPLASFKSPTSTPISEPLEIDTKLSMELYSNTDDGNSSGVNSALTTPDTSLDASSQSVNSFSHHDDAAIQSNEKIPSARKRTVNYPGKIKGKLNNRKKAKLVEYRRKRGSKGRCKSYPAPVAVANFPSNSGASIHSNEVDSKAQDDSNENKMILCSSKDSFVMTQDLCIMCGSLGKDDEGRLLSCSQCGQCYHPFCAGVTKITSIMIKKGWRCLECTVCEGCGKPTDESRLLLCDDCDISYHTYCLDPPLENVPQGTWKCQWCVMCIKCNATTPGYGSQWQANYTLCGPCASQQACSLCQDNYQENDLIIQCVQCSRWLHSKCDSMLDEDECEIASHIGYTCLRCRPSDQLPPHIRARRNGTLRSVLNKKRSEEKIEAESTANKKPDTVPNDVPEAPSTTSSEPVAVPPAPTAESTALTNNLNKQSKYHIIDGVYLSDYGLSVIKSLTLEQPKKTRGKRKTNSLNEDADHKELDESLEEKVNDLESLAKQNEEERKARQRRLRLEKLGIGGFSVKQRGRLSCNKEEEDLNLELERSGTPEGDKPRRRRRINKKKSMLQESFPSYMQEAFFGKELLDSTQANNSQRSSSAGLPLSEPETEEDDLDSLNSTSRVSVLDLPPADLGSTKHKSEEINFLDDNFQASLDDDLPPGESFDDLQLSPDDMIMDMLINENLEGNDEVLEELTNGSKIDGDVKDEDMDANFLDGNFNFNDIVDESGLPQMDSKDVEDLFNEVMSDSSLQTSKDFPLPPDTSSGAQLMPKPTVEQMHLANPMMQIKGEISATHPPVSNVPTPITPLSAGPLASLTPKPYAPTIPPQQQPPAVGVMAPYGQPTVNQEAVHQWQNNDTDSESATQGQKNLLKWEAEEALGAMATISPVLYANVSCPHLKTDYPVWSDRLKQISKLWRQLSTDQRQPFLQKARENRAAQRIQKSQTDSAAKIGNTPIGPDIKNEPEQKQWKDLQSPHSNPASVMMADPNVPLQCQRISSPANEMQPFGQISEYGHQGGSQMYPSQPMHPQVKMQSSSPLLMNRPPLTPGPALLQSPMSPMLHSPRLRPTMQGSFPAENYGAQGGQPHQMNMVRPSPTMVSQGSFSPSSPSLNQVHSIPSAECYHSSNPSTPQRPQSTDPQHPFGQAASPYGGPPRTPSGMMNPFSPSHHSQMPSHHSVMGNDNYSLSSHPTTPQGDSAQSVDMYKVNMTPQHPLSKPHTPDSFVPSLPSSLPSTPQPPSSPQVPTPSPLSDIYARSPATPRSAPVNSQVRPPFDDSYNQRPLQPDLYSPTNTSGSFQQPFMQPNNYNMADGFANPQAAAKGQIRPNLNPSIRANVPIRRTLSSDPYARQPMTPMPAPSDSHNLYAKPDDTNNDPSKQQLRNLLQVQQIRRPDATPHPRPNWIDNGFRQPLSPAMTRNRMPIPSPNQYSMEQSFRYPPTEQQRMMMQRTPDVRFRQMGPVAHQQQFSVRYPQQMAQTHSPGQQQPQGHSQQVKPPGPQQQQQWARMAMHSPASSNADMSPMISPNANCQTTQSQANAQYSQHAPNYPQPNRNELNPSMHLRHEPQNLGMHDNRALPSDIGQLGEDENLPVELGDNDDLLELGDDFNILEYADDELPDKALSGHSGKSNIFDELDEKDMLNEKDKEGASSKAGEGARSQTDKSIARPGFNQAPFNSPNPVSKMGPVSGGQVSRVNKPKATESEQSIARQEQQGYFQNADCLLSDDEFERLKMDFFNDPSEPNHQLAQPVGDALPGQHSQQQSQGLPIPSQAQHHQLSMPQQGPLPQQPAPALQFHQQPHNTQFSQTSQVQPMWQGQQPQPGNFPSRMHLRLPANQVTSIPRHLQPPSQQPMYGPTPNRMMHHQPQQQAGHMPMATTSMGPIRHPLASIPAPPPPPHEVMNEQDRQQQVQYEQWLIQQNNFIAKSQKNLETEVSKLRKMKKSLNAKQRQCRKNQNELNEHDSNELARVSAEIHGLQKTLDQTRKSMRQHNLLIQDYRQKHGSTFNLPHSPGATTVQTSPRSVNSPLAAMTASGPGTPLGIGPSTPQSPSITSPSPSSLMQNSPMSALHSPAPLMPPSPIHHSPMPNINQDMSSMRPQIVQEDNNPFSDVYLQKEKKQHMHQSPVYSHPMSNEMADSRQQMYGSTGYCEDGSIQQPQQYYHPQSQMSYQMGGMRPQQTHPHYPPMNDSANYPAPRFGSPHSQPLNQQYVNQQLNYQQIRRPPPPPYPGKPQHFNARPPYQGNPQIRPQQQQLRPSQECGPMRMQHAMYNEGGGPMMSSDQYGHNQQVDGSMQHMGAMDPSKNPIVGDAITSMEFNLNELGPGHDNQSDPSSLVQETEEQKPHATSDSASDLQANQNQASTSQEGAPLSTFIKREIDDTSNKLNANEEFNASQTGQFMEDDGNCHATAGINFANETEESMASKQEATRQNALLKQLLQNCPSADLNKVSEAAAATNPSSPTIAIEKEIKFENAEKSSCQHAQAQAQEALLSNAVHIQPKKDSSVEMDLLLGDSMSNQSMPLTHQDGNMSSPSSHSTSSQVVEKKMTYLDIRRAQLERDPTPPPEEKPKRKRTIKRKESKSIDESMESTSSQSGGPPITPKVSKKRSRKGSQNRAEETNNGNEHQEHMLKGLINHLRNCPNMTIIEPTIRPNLNVCLPPDSPDFNSKEIKLKGSYGKAYLSSTIDFYSTYPLGPNKVTSVVPTLPPAAQNSSSSHNRAFYYEEFSYMKNIPELADHFKDQGDKNSSFLQFSRDTDSPDTVVSSSSPECVFYDMPPDEYNKMRYINEDSSTQLDLERDCDSPILFRPVPIRSSPLYGDEEVDKENLHDCQKVRSVRLNGMPLKETGNVNITLMLDSEQDVRNIILSLAKILKVTSSITYNIEKSPASSVTDVVEIDYDDIESRLGFCKLCEEPLEENADFQMDEGEFSKGNFCSKQCSDSYLLANSLKQPDKPDTLIDQGMEGINDKASQQLAATEDEESELMSIFGGDSGDFAKAMLDLEGINIDEKRWKNTRYLYWNKSSFKADPKATSEGTEDEESTEQALDKLAICLKPSANAVEKRECIFCHQLGDGDINGASRLLNMDIDMWVHLNCALWSFEVYEMLNGALMNVDQAYLRAVNLPCVRCSQRGASLKCFKLRCNNSYHFPCAVKEKCIFFKDKTILCPQHSPKSAHPNPDELTSFAVARRVFINRDDQKQIATMIHQGDNQLLRIGSLIFLNIGQLLPHQLQSFHTNSYIYPVGYKISRFYWSSRRLGKRCQYICSIAEKDGKPEFVVEIREEGYENVTYRESTTKLVWQKVLEPIIKMREESQTIKVFADFISGEDLFGLTEPTIIRILESLPGVDSLYHYNFKYGRSPWYDLPLAINPTGCARTEPKMRTHFRRPHTLHVSNNNSGRSSVHASLGTCDNASPYVKQFVHNKVSQYCKMKSQWRNNVILARSRIQGIGLYAAKDIEKHTMIIEYIGLLIRNEMAERNERIHEAHNRGIYMFRLDDNRVIDATLTGGLARYINHSCDPNCVAECVQIGNENKILIISNRKITKGEEFTYDYKFEVEDDQHKIPCHCGAVNCRKWMN